MTVGAAHPDSGFFTASITLTLVVVAIVLVSALTLTASAALQSRQRGTALQARYAAQALIVKVRREIETSGTALPAWDGASRREVWAGQIVSLRVLSGHRGEGDVACLAGLGVEAVSSSREMLFVAGAPARAAMRVQIVDRVIAGPEGLRTVDRQLLHGAVSECS